ncbi:MAG: carboxypeptidase-like regulatory domain-containing protein [Bacteroidia bacterium]
MNNYYLYPDRRHRLDYFELGMIIPVCGALRRRQTHLNNSTLIKPSGPWARWLFFRPAQRANPIRLALVGRAFFFSVAHVINLFQPKPKSNATCYHDRSWLTIVCKLAICTNRERHRNDAGDGSPIQGAAVLVKDYSVGTWTDDQGRYKLDLPANAEALVFFRQGKRAQTITIGGRTTINVQWQKISSKLRSRRYGHWY